MRAALTPNLHYIKPKQANFGKYTQHMVSHHRFKKPCAAVFQVFSIPSSGVHRLKGQ